MYVVIGILAVFALFYSLFAGRIEKTIFSGPIIFIAFGYFIGPLGMGWINFDVNNEQVRLLVDLTLSLVLFLDAANADKITLRKSAHIPIRLLLIGLPLTIISGVAAGFWLFPELGILQLAILAIMLTATDAALGKAVVVNKAVPTHIRESLNVESGLNDGLCVPILLVFIAFATNIDVNDGGLTLIVRLMLEEIGIGLAVGLCMTYVAAKLIAYCWKQDWITEIWMQVPVFMLAIICFTLAQSLGGSGYIAAFSGGLLFGIIVKKHTHELILSAEGISEIFAMLTWILFGAIVIFKTYTSFNWQVVSYTFLSLTVVRMLPVFISLFGTKEMTVSKLFIGWFGPRGLASIVFAIIVLNNEIEGAEQMAIIVVFTVLVSAFLHGVTANPFTRALNKKLENNG